MKTLKDFLVFGILSSIFAGFSCKSNEEDNGSCDIVMADGKIQEPQWLKPIIDSLSNIHKSIVPNYMPNMYTLEHRGRNYMLVRDDLCPSISLGYLFVSCSGKKVIPESKLWWELMDEILPCDIKLADEKVKSPQWLVQAIDSVENLYSSQTVLSVYSLPYQEQDYIFLKDGFASTLPQGQALIFYTCLGEKIVPESDLWNELKKYNNRYLLLVWMNVSLFY